MSIKSYVDELEQIHIEIKRNNTRNTLLRKRIKELENSISEYLIEKGQQGLKYKGNAITVAASERRPIKKKKEKEAALHAMLEELGVKNPEIAWNKLKEVQKGDPVEEKKLKIQKLKKQK